MKLLFWPIPACQQNRLCGDCLPQEQVGLLTQPSSCLLREEKHLASPLYRTLVDSCLRALAESSCGPFLPGFLEQALWVARNLGKGSFFFFFFLNPLLHVASENQTCPTEWLACSVNICEILSSEQPFTEDQDSYDDPDGGLFAIKVIVTPVEEFLLCAPPVSEHLIFVVFNLPESPFYKSEN